MGATLSWAGCQDIQSQRRQRYIQHTDENTPSARETTSNRNKRQSSTWRVTSRYLHRWSHKIKNYWWIRAIVETFHSYRPVEYPKSTVAERVDSNSYRIALQGLNAKRTNHAKPIASGEKIGESKYWGLAGKMTLVIAISPSPHLNLGEDWDTRTRREGWTKILYQTDKIKT